MNLLGRTPKITRSTLQPSVCQNHVATEVLLVLGTNTTSSINSYTHTAVETTREPTVWSGRLDQVWGRLDRLHQATEKFSETPLLNTKKHHGPPLEISGQGQASYQEILAKIKTSPRGLRAVRPATKGGLTSCT
jgi:2-iminoacetate synthase ThiH